MSSAKEKRRVKYSQTSPKEESPSDVDEYIDTSKVVSQTADNMSYKKPLYTMLSHIRKKPTVSPKRTNSYYSRSKRCSLEKPEIAPYNKSAEKKCKAKIVKLPPKHATRRAQNKENVKPRPSPVENSRHEILEDKVNAKIFKQIDECLQILETNSKLSTCIDKLQVVEKLCLTAFDETDVI